MEDLRIEFPMTDKVLDEIVVLARGLQENHWTRGDTPEARKVRYLLAVNEIERERRRNRIRELVGHPLSARMVERIVALSTGLEQLYDLGEPPDAVICRYLRKHRDKDFDEVLRRATWVFVAQ